MENLNLVSLPHFVSVENLSVEEVEALINRAEYFKNGGATPNLTEPICITNMFLKIQVERILVLKWLKEN